jgi:CTP:phosphocholine cytidylyltransferase-like protein
MSRTISIWRNFYQFISIFNGKILFSHFSYIQNEAFIQANYLVEILSTSIHTFRGYKYFTKKLAQTLMILINAATVSLESSTEKKKFEHLFVKVNKQFLILLKTKDISILANARRFWCLAIRSNDAIPYHFRTYDVETFIAHIHVA